MQQKLIFIHFIKFCLASFVLLYFCAFANSDKIYRIELKRQRTPREYALHTANNPKIGLYLDWLKHEDHIFKKKDNRTNDTIPLKRFLDSEYYGEINIGSPGQKFKMLFDTAWSSSWVISKLCSDAVVGCKGHEKYDHSHSSTYTANNTRVVFDETVYNISGFYSLDSMVIGHSRVNDQTFVEVDNINYINAFSQADGVLGLGFKTNDINPFFYNLMQQTNITNPVFSIFLNRDRQSRKGGSITLGAVDKKHIHVTNKVYDEITYVPVDSSTGYWSFRLDKLIIDKGKKYTVLCNKGCEAIADSSNNLIITSQPDLTAINIQLNARTNAKYVGRYEVDCDTVNKLPKFEFVLNGRNFTLKGKNYIQKISKESQVLCLSAFTSSSTASEENRWILGGAFLSEFYSIYNIREKQIGFVKAA